MSKIVATLSIVFALSQIAWGQAAFMFPKGDAQWAVDVQSTAPAGGAPNPKHVDVTVFNNIKRIAIQLDNGKTSEKWKLPGLPVTFIQDPRTGTVRPHQPGGPAMLMDAFQDIYDEEAFDWVTPANLQGKDPIDYGGKQCFHYVGSVTLPNMTVLENGSTPTVQREAWIDAKTLLPVALKSGMSLSVFTFADKPPTSLTPPPAVAHEIAYYKGVMGYP